MHNFTADRWNLHQSVVGAFGLAGLSAAREVVADGIAIRFRGDALTDILLDSETESQTRSAGRRVRFGSWPCENSFRPADSAVNSANLS